LSEVSELRVASPELGLSALVHLGSWPPVWHHTLIVCHWFRLVHKTSLKLAQTLLTT